MVRLWRALSNLGVDARVSAIDEKHIVLLNQLFGVNLVLNAVFLLFPITWVVGGSARFAGSAIFGCAVSLLLNWRRRHRAARLFGGYYFLSNVALLSLATPPEVESALLLLALASGAWLVNPGREWRTAALYNTVAVAAFFSIGWWQAQPGRSWELDPALIAEGRKLTHANLAGLLVFIGIYTSRTSARADDLLQLEREKWKALLLNVLPQTIADRLLAQPGTIADRVQSATILFADLANFTTLSERVSAPELVKKLDAVFSAFDALAERHGLEKIKTIGDAYMVAGGVPDQRAGHAHAVAHMALEMLQALRGLPEAQGLNLRIGIATGPVVAGVIGKKKFSYDLWGDTVNTASRMESHGQVGRIHVSQSVHDALAADFAFEPRGVIEVKGKGPLNTFFLLGARPPPATGPVS